MVSAARLLSLMEYAGMQAATNPRADFAEVGVYRGGTALLLAKYKSETSWLHLFDTFTGLPAPTLEDTHKEGEFACDIESVRRLLAEYPRVAYYKGVFPRDTAGSLIGKFFSLVHLDCDLYDGVKAGLAEFSKRMVPGGMIVLDDIYCPDCPGALKATEEFCESTGRKVVYKCETQGVIQF